MVADSALVLFFSLFLESAWPYIKNPLEAPRAEFFSVAAFFATVWTELCDET
jgi:hypothetical protein